MYGHLKRFKFRVKLFSITMDSLSPRAIVAFRLHCEDFDVWVEGFGSNGHPTYHTTSCSGNINKVGMKIEKKKIALCMSEKSDGWVFCRKLLTIENLRTQTRELMSRVK